jgi:hypothetical protein
MLFHLPYKKEYIMSNKELLLQNIETLPSDYVNTVLDFVEYLKAKQTRKIPETMFLSESSLAKDWDTPEEDEAWANL